MNAAEPNVSHALVVGAGGHALVVADILRLQGYDVIGFVDLIAPERDGERHGDCRVFGGEGWLERFDYGARGAIVAIGDNRARARVAERLAGYGYVRLRAIHPSAVVAADAEIGPGSVVAAGAVVNSFARVGDDVIVNTCASVDHECVVGDAAHVSPGARLAGKAWIGPRAWIGIGASVVERVRVGADTIVGAGAAVISDLPAGVVAVGVPARVVKRREREET